MARVLVSNGLTARTGSITAAAHRVRAWMERAAGGVRSVRDVDDSLDELACAMDDAWYALLARTGNAVLDVGDGFAVRTGLFDNSRSGVVCSHVPDQDLERTVADALAFLREAAAPARWHAFADVGATGCSTIGIVSPTVATVPYYEGLGFSLRPVPPDRSYYLPLP